MRVEWCMRNQRLGTRDVIDRLRNVDLSTNQYVRYACLDFCDLCARQPFVLVDNQPIGEATATELHEKLTAFIHPVQGRP